MRYQTLTLTLAAVGLCASLAGQAQTPPVTNPLDAIPENIPFDVPYGSPPERPRASGARLASWRTAFS